MPASGNSTGPSLCSPLYDEAIVYCRWVKCWLDNIIFKSLVW